MAKSNKISITTKNFSEFAELLESLPEAVRRNVLPKSMGAAAKPISRNIRSRANRRSGALAKSITHVVREYAGSPPVAVVGPDKDYYQDGRRLSKSDSRRGADRPANYAHLVNNGHLNRDGSSTPGSFFMERGVEAGIPEAATEFYRQTADGLDEQVAKGLTKLKR